MNLQMDHRRNLTHGYVDHEKPTCMFLHDFVGKVGSITPFGALCKVSMYGMSRYWVAAMITVRSSHLYC